MEERQTDSQTDRQRQADKGRQTSGRAHERQSEKESAAVTDRQMQTG